MGDNRNMILAIVLSVLIFAGFQAYLDWRHPPLTPEQQQAQQNAQRQSAQPPAGQQAPGVPGQGVQAPMAQGDDSGTDVPRPGGAPTAADIPGADQDAARTKVLEKSPRVSIQTKRLRGSITLRGGRFDDLTLSDYLSHLDPASPKIDLLNPQGTPGAFFADFGWVGSGVKLPDANTMWTPNVRVLSTEHPLTLLWDNGQGLEFRRTIAIDQDYLFTITQEVTNKGSTPVTLNSYGLISRHGTPVTLGFYILHEGPLGVFDGVLEEVNYEDLREDGPRNVKSTGGWIGITDKYWMAALVPDQKTAIDARFHYRKTGTLDKYQTDYLGPAVTIQPGTQARVSNRLFAGAKEVKVLDGYADHLGIGQFDKAIDFGWFYFLTKPIFYALIWLYGHIGNFGVAILLLTVAIKLAFFPLANKSYVAMSKMKKLQPEMIKLRERFGDDKVKLNQEMMGLYKREKANPASGCLPIIIQIPVFFALYKVLYVNIEMRHAPFFGWIQDLSAPDPTTLFNLFGLINWTPPEILMIGVWPLFMGASMFLQQRLNPQPTDPVQAKIFLFLPLFFTFLLAKFPAGLVIYWAWNNTLSIAQQYVIMRRMGVKA